MSRDFSEAVFSSWRAAGPALVEASAGTGKTFNVQSAYLRLVLAGLSVQQILVVTFTEAATRELRERLRSVLLLARNSLDGSPPDGNDSERIHRAIQGALSLPGSSPDVLLRRLRLALMDFDSASIYTIHGFCNRVLERHAFECGHDPDAELLPEQRRLVAETCQDWWRQNAYGSHADAVPFQSAGDLARFVSARADHPDAELRGGSLDPFPGMRELADACRQVLPLVGHLRSAATWAGAARIRRGKGPELDLSTLADVVERNRSDFSGWLDRLPPCVADSAEASTASSAAFLVRSLLVPSRDSDAKPFLKCLRTFADGAESAFRLPLQAAIVDELARTVRRRVRDRAALTYDDMLLNVRDVLRRPDVGPRLKQVLRDEFKAAMIDEFQDTDPVQYEIFRTLFDDGEAPALAPPLLYVGDPKQAIYGFRNGDVYTYFEAKDRIADAYSLGTNYRSDPLLVAALNELFRDDESGGAFLDARVPYAEDLAATPLAEKRRLFDRGSPDEAPLHVWTFEAVDTAADGSSARSVCRAVAEEIVRLLASPDLRIGSGDNARPIRPSDVAVLVMTHPEAELVQREILARGVHAVRQSKGSVFDSDESRELALVMRAMMSPGNALSVRGALCAGFMPCSLDQVASFHAEAGAAPRPAEPAVAASPASLEEWIELFREAGLSWQTHSFVEAFELLSRRLNLRAHVAGLPDGPRRLANLRHLVELAHQAARGRKLSPPALLRWFVRQLDDQARDDAGDDESGRSRVADDGDAVQIMTVFKSKGLEFPIVFLPTLWRRSSQSQGLKECMLKYHVGTRLELNMDVEDGYFKQCAASERHAENVRLAYVALTRAVNRVYLAAPVHDRLNPANHALASLLERWRRSRPDAGADLPRIVGHVRLLPLPSPDPALGWSGRDSIPNPESLRARLPPPVDGRSDRASFSSLMSHKEERDWDSDALPAPPPARDRFDADPIFAIPGGAKLGSCWHEIFELADFQAPPDALDRIVDDALDRHGVCARSSDACPASKRAWIESQRDAVRRMVRRVLSAPIDAGQGAFRLCDVPWHSRRSELEFHFALQKRRPRTIADLRPLLDEFWTSPGRNEAFIENLAGMAKPIPPGFMSGFIDLVFEHRGRFHLVDWKSNQIDGIPDNFNAPGLAAEMAAHSYHLQYLIYVAALHGFLAQSLAGYDYDVHFGGVFYFFLRGVDGHSGRGIFFDRPPLALVERLSQFFGGDAP